MKKIYIVLFSLFILSASHSRSFGQTVICSGGQACLTLTGVRGNIQWQKSADQVNWLIMNGATDDTLCFAAFGSSYYRAEIREGTCAPFFSSVMQVTITISPTADAGPDQAFCVGGNAILGGAPSANSGTPPYTYFWSTSNGLSSGTNSNPICTATQTTNYVMTVTDSNGCTATDTVSVAVTPSPTADAGLTVSIPCSLTTVLGGGPTATGGAPPYTYAWTPANYLTSATVANPVAHANDTTLFYVTVTDSVGCTGTDSVLINVFGTTGGGSGSQVFNFTGTQQIFVVPSCIDSVRINCRGAEGANSQDRLTTNSTAGMGGVATGTIGVTAGDTLYVIVGGMGSITGTGGYNGGGRGGTGSAGSSCVGGPAGGGGGASDVRRGGTALSNRVIVAGGGGGSGRDYCNGTCQPCGCGGSGGNGGALTGLNGLSGYDCGFSYPGTNINLGSGGTPALGGAGGACDNTCIEVGTAGSSGLGGDGGNGTYDVAGGGGGGGYFGGGGGGSANSGSGVAGGGGGGGSSFVTGLSGGATTPGVQSGNGTITISW